MQFIVRAGFSPALCLHCVLWFGVKSLLDSPLKAVIMTNTSRSIDLTKNRECSPGAVSQLIRGLIQREEPTLVRALVVEQQALQPQGGDSHQRHSPCGNRVEVKKKWEARCTERDGGKVCVIVTLLVISQVSGVCSCWRVMLCHTENKQCPQKAPEYDRTAACARANTQTAGHTHAQT